MTGDAIFLVRSIGDSQELLPMDVFPYEREGVLQELLERYPDLLAGGQTVAGESRRWLLVDREAGVPRAEGGGRHWSMDHLFLDQDGVPTFVEVKRADSREIRRMVVGQLFDYAANASRYWPPDDPETPTEGARSKGIRAMFEARCKRRGEDPAAVLMERLGVPEPDRFWKTVRQNLDAGRIRMVFVADEIPDELQRIIEFLNGQMKDAEVFGVEVRRYKAHDVETLVPRVVGLTAQAKETKGQRPGKTYEELLRGAPDAVRRAADVLLSWAKANGYTVRETPAGRTVGTSDGIDLLSFFPGFQMVAFNVVPLETAHDSKEREHLLGVLTRIAGRKVSERYPQIRCDALVTNWDEFRREFLQKYIAARKRAASAHTEETKSGN